MNYFKGNVSHKLRLTIVVDVRTTNYVSFLLMKNNNVSTCINPIVTPIS